MPEIKYQHAFMDGCDDKIISINDVTAENRKQYKFRCIGCGNELLPRAIGSKYRRPHFYHREIVECSGETYLHKLAKHAIKEKFDREDTFLVEYLVTKDCNNAGCKYRNHRCRKERNLYTIDLKKFYDTCEEEVPVKGFVADILLTDRQNPNREPTLIEVCVSHACDDDKRNSGLRIIEVKIKDEQDVFNLRNKDFWKENEFAHPKEQQVEFISFKREIKKPEHVQLNRYLYNPQQNLLGSWAKVPCSKAQLKLETDSLVELNVVETNNYGDTFISRMATLLWMAKHKGLRRCNMCKFYFATIYEDIAKCRLYKKYGKPEYPSMDEAERCRYYMVDRQIPPFYNQDGLLIEEVTSPPILPAYKVILTASRSFDNYKLYKEKILYYLSDKMKTHSVVVMTASTVADWLTDRLSEEVDFIYETHKAEWDKYGESAINISQDEMTSSADALIAFWDGKSTGIRDLIRKAEMKGLKVAKVGY